MTIIRKISSTVLLITTFLLLMNGIIPHHHHEEEVCYVSVHCSDEEIHEYQVESEKDAISHEQHSHETDFCQILNFYLTSDGKNLNSKNYHKNLNRDFSIIVYSISDNYVLDLHTNTFEYSYDKDQVGLNAKYLIRALRAPPSA